MKNMIALLILFVGFNANAQNPNSKSANNSPSLSKMQTSLGGLKGGSVTKEVLSQIVDSAIMVKDQSGKSMPVVHFRVFYKFKSTSEDRDTGERKTVDDMRENEFLNTALMSDNWRESIKDNATKDDEMIIDNVMVKLANGKKLLVGGLKFKVTE